MNRLTPPREMYQLVPDPMAACTNCIDEQLGFGRRGFEHEAQRTAGTRIMCDEDCLIPVMDASF